MKCEHIIVRKTLKHLLVEFYQLSTQRKSAMAKRRTKYKVREIPTEAKGMKFITMNILPVWVSAFFLSHLLFVCCFFFGRRMEKLQFSRIWNGMGKERGTLVLLVKMKMISNIYFGSVAKSLVKYCFFFAFHGKIAGKELHKAEKVKMIVKKWRKVHTKQKSKSFTPLFLK